MTTEPRELQNDRHREPVPIDWPIATVWGALIALDLFVIWSLVQRMGLL